MGYARDGLYGERDEGRSMAIRYSDEALATQLHPIARVHPETGRTALFVTPGYTIGIEGVADAEARELLTELFRHQRQESFIYRHRWSPRGRTRVGASYSHLDRLTRAEQSVPPGLDRSPSARSPVGTPLPRGAICHWIGAMRRWALGNAAVEFKS